MGVPGNANALLLRSAAAAGGYQISRSLRFNSSDSAYLSRTPASAGNRKTWTWAAWVKRSAIAFSAEQHIWGVTGVTDATYGEMFFGTGDTLRFVVGYNTAYGITTTRVFRDPSAWFHIVLAFDATQGTAANRIRLYINGVEETAFSSDNRSSLANQDWGYNNNVAHYIGRQPNSDIRHFNGYLADIHFIDGQALTPSSFTEVSATTGQLIPKAYTGTFTGNSFWLKFSDNSSTTSGSNVGIGKDFSGLGNYWDSTNLSVTAGAGNDSLVDTPTSYGTGNSGGDVRGNFCTWNPLASNASMTLTNGNLESKYTIGSWVAALGSIGVNNGKWYWEITLGDSTNHMYGVAFDQPSLSSHNTSMYGYYNYDGSKWTSGIQGSAYGNSSTTGDVIGIALDLSAGGTSGAIIFYKNGVSMGPAFSNLDCSKTYVPWVLENGNSAGSYANFGQRPFAYTAPSGFKALCDTNLTAPVVAKPNTVMDVILYTGTGANATIPNVNTVPTSIAFTPDLVWIKGRSGATDHALYDSVRDVQKDLVSNSTAAETTQSTGLTAFGTNTFNIGTLAKLNTSSSTYVGWCWDAGSSTVTNTQGSITSSVRANATAGFSIVTYTGTGSNATVGHGLGVAPFMFIVKNRGTSSDWDVYHGSLATPATSRLVLQSTAAVNTGTSAWNSTNPTSTVVSLGVSTSANANGNTHVMYCFAPVVGYSAMSSFVGNGSSEGPFCWCGFRPRFILLKNASYAGADWYIHDTATNAYNVVGNVLRPNTSGAENTYTLMDVLSNGFKMRNTFDSHNRNGDTIIWAAFAESPFQYARAR